MLRAENSTEHQRTIFGPVFLCERAGFCTKNSKYFCHNSWPSIYNCAVCALMLPISKKTPHNFWSKFVNSSHSSMRLHGLADFPEVFSNFFHIFLRLQRRDIADLRYSLGGSGWKHSRSLLNSFIVPCWKLKNQFKNNFCLWTNFQVLIESKRMAEN